jgi:hypothetical protein
MLHNTVKCIQFYMKIFYLIIGILAQKISCKVSSILISRCVDSFRHLNRLIGLLTFPVQDAVKNCECHHRVKHLNQAYMSYVGFL